MYISRTVQSCALNPHFNHKVHFPIGVLYQPHPEAQQKWLKWPILHAKLSKPAMLLRVCLGKISILFLLWYPYRITY